MDIRAAAVADLFYPGSENDLEALIIHALNKARPALLPAPTQSLKAVIVPHAGFIYSGQTAAFAFASMIPAHIQHIILLGPSHRIAFRGMAVPDCDAFETPFGLVKVDHKRMQKALIHADVQINAAAHAQEHSLEVQLPFLQTVLDQFTLLPICIGSVEADVVAQLIESFWYDDATLFVISSDLSHFHSYQEANTIDELSIDMILRQQASLNHEQACGATGINALLNVANKHHLKAQLLDYRNSGDTAGDKERVVGYASIAFFDDVQDHA
ncbi:AmmeMemoRadiSam system protein B [Mariprofundus sp. EBB-1]|uniref:AmmeMemoRadiSam system protein B n=1 Tax=Mariprofundus sp. EBB-1 TaxID=2650971 RepID=UPI000EF21650|nr:AmmeMemoRadiSam system protein B [Mariprofundus sp. EBB-1]RLL55633.1 AmmeMemoRadiSam system protein B [Mariprofundus sp. EBB-1]